MEAGCGAGTDCAEQRHRQRHQPQCGVQCLQSGRADVVAQRRAGSTGGGRESAELVEGFTLV